MQIKAIYLFLNAVLVSTQLFAAPDFPQLTEKEALFFERVINCRGLHIAKYLSKSQIVFTKSNTVAAIETDSKKLNCVNVIKEIEALKKEYNSTNADMVRKTAVEKTSSLQLDMLERIAIQNMLGLSKALSLKKYPEEIDSLGRRMLVCAFLDRLSGGGQIPFFVGINSFGLCQRIPEEYNQAKAKPRYANYKSLFDLPIWQMLFPPRGNLPPARIVASGLTKAEVQWLLKNYGLFLSSFVAVSLPEGLLLKEIKAGSLLKKIGLEPGDTVILINDKIFNSTDQLLRMYFFVQSQGHMHLQVKRNTEHLTFHLTFLTETAKPPTPTKPVGAPVQPSVVPAANKPGAPAPKVLPKPVSPPPAK